MLTMTKIHALQEERAILVKEIRDIVAEQLRLHERKLEKMDLLAACEAEMKTLAMERNPA
jgi:hypothetical protein